MKKHISIFDRLMMAVTFAEADEHETASQFMGMQPPTETKNQTARPYTKKADIDLAKGNVR